MSQSANIKDSLAPGSLCHPPAPRPWHLSGRIAPIWAPCRAEAGLPPPTRGHTAPEPKPGTIWCESGLMKVQHGAKWVSTTAGRGANDKPAPWARCCCRYLCQGIWQLAECLTCVISYRIFPENVRCILASSLPIFHLSSASSFLALLCSDGLSVWLLSHKHFLSEVYCEIVFYLFIYSFVHL